MSKIQSDKCINCNGTGYRQVFSVELNYWVYPKTPIPCKECRGRGKVYFRVVHKPTDWLKQRQYVNPEWEHIDVEIEERPSMEDVSKIPDYVIIREFCSPDEIDKWEQEKEYPELWKKALVNLARVRAIKEGFSILAWRI